jgi:hypothetical protein
MINTLHKLFTSFGINLPQLLMSLYDLPAYVINFFKLYKSKNGDKGFEIKNFYPVLGEKYKPGGTIKSHYFIQDLFVAQKIFKAQPVTHYDIGSRVDGFVAHLATFMNVTVLDIREIPNQIQGINFVQFDITKSDSIKNNSLESISSLHVFEHIGLGRYGDEIDYNGHIKALKNVFNILIDGGIFYFSVPIGKQRIEYNAHRVFSTSYLYQILKGSWDIIEFSYINDLGILHENQNIELSFDSNINYGCGIFILKKKCL